MPNTLKNTCFKWLKGNIIVNYSLLCPNASRTWPWCVISVQDGQKAAAFRQTESQVKPSRDTVHFQHWLMSVGTSGIEHIWKNKLHFPSTCIDTSQETQELNPIQVKLNTMPSVQSHKTHTSRSFQVVVFRLKKLKQSWFVGAHLHLVSPQEREQLTTSLN